jgi:hypothetical protein
MRAVSPYLPIYQPTLQLELDFKVRAGEELRCGYALTTGDQRDRTTFRLFKRFQHRQLNYLEGWEKPCMYMGCYCLRNVPYYLHMNRNPSASFSPTQETVGDRRRSS